MTLSIVLPTEAEALAACDIVDDALGYPREDTDQHGRAVITSRWTHPVALEDGTWAVQVPEGPWEMVLPQEPEERDLMALRRRDVFDL